MKKNKILKRKTVYLELDLDQALVLFEWSYHFMETQKLQFSCRAEPIVIDKIASELEKTLKEPFKKEYPAQLKSARDELEKNYREAMKPHCAWLEKFEYKAE